MGATRTQFYHVIKSLISNHIKVQTRHGTMGYLQEFNNIVFITSEWQNATDDMAFYMANPPILNMHLEISWAAEMEEQLHYVNSLSSTSDKKNLIVHLPFEFQEMYLETSLLAKESTEMTKWVIRTYDPYITKNPIRSTLIPNRPRVLIDGEWRDEEEKGNNGSVEDKKIFGTYRNKNNDFIVIDARKLSYNTPADLVAKKRGQACSTTSKQNLVNILSYLNVMPENDSLLDVVSSRIYLLQNKIIPETNSNIQLVAYWSTKKIPELCEALKNYLTSNNFII
jgi:hypothetical protein